MLLLLSALGTSKFFLECGLQSRCWNSRYTLLSIPCHSSLLTWRQRQMAELDMVLIRPLKPCP